MGLISLLLPLSVIEARMDEDREVGDGRRGEAKSGFADDLLHVYHMETS